MSLDPHVGPLTTSVCGAAFWFSNDIRKCVSSEEEELGVGGEEGGGGEGRGGQLGKRKKKRKAQDEEQWKGRCSNVPVVSQPQSSCVDRRRCMGWMTNKFRKWSRVGGPLIIRFQLTFNPQPLRALCLLRVTPRWWRPPLEFVLDSGSKTGGGLGTDRTLCARLCPVCQLHSRKWFKETLPKNSPGGRKQTTPPEWPH